MHGTAFPAIKDHVLLRHASMLTDVDEALATALTRDVIARILEHVPDEWLRSDGAGLQPADVRAAYNRYLRRSA